MARGKKKLTLDEQLAKVTAEIEVTEATLWVRRADSGKGIELWWNKGNIEQIVILRKTDSGYWLYFLLFFFS